MSDWILKVEYSDKSANWVCPAILTDRDKNILELILDNAKYMLNENVSFIERVQVDKEGEK